MSKVLTLQDAADLTLGASFYSTGGGFERGNQMRFFDDLFAKGTPLTLVSLDELRDDDLVCTGYTVGSPSDTSKDVTPALRAGLMALQNHVGKPFAALFPAETNIEAVAFQAAAALDLPVLDADTTGGRAVPEIQFDNFFVAEKNILPAAVATLSGDVSLLLESASAQAIEKFVRGIAAAEGGLVAAFDHAVNARDARDVLTTGIFARSMRAGAFAREHRGKPDAVASLLSHLQATMLIEGMITASTLEDTPSFLTGTYTVTNERGDELQVFVKNENILCWFNGNVRLTCPDLIVTIDPEALAGVHNSLVRVGHHVVVAGIPATPFWRTPKGLRIFHPGTLGFAIPQVLL